jgi:hypothetical protein
MALLLADMLFLPLVAILSYQDLKTHSMDNIYIIALWIAFAMIRPETAFIAIIAFALFLLVDYIYNTKPPIFALGDVYVMPIVFAWLTAIFGMSCAILILSLPYYASAIDQWLDMKKCRKAKAKAIPLVYWIGAFSVAMLALSLLMPPMTAGMILTSCLGIYLISCFR